MNSISKWIDENRQEFLAFAIGWCGMSAFTSLVNGNWLGLVLISPFVIYNIFLFKRSPK